MQNNKTNKFFPHILTIAISILITSSALCIASGSESLRKSALQQAQLVASSLKAGRYDILVSMCPTALIESVGDSKELEAMLEKSLGAGGKIKDAKAGPVLSLAKFKGEAFATVATETHIEQDGDLAIIHGYLLCVSSNNGKKWEFMAGSNKTKQMVASCSKKLLSQLVFPPRKMVMGDFVFVHKNGKWTPDAKSLDKMKEILKKSKGKQ